MDGHVRCGELPLKRGHLTPTSAQPLLPEGEISQFDLNGNNMLPPAELEPPICLHVRRCIHRDTRRAPALFEPQRQQGRQTDEVHCSFV